MAFVSVILGKPLKVFLDVMSQETIVLEEVDPSETIANLKKKIRDKKGFPALEQRLVFHGKILEDQRTINDYSIQNNSTLNLVLPWPVLGKHFFYGSHCPNGSQTASFTNSL